jgi:hypothetical protein
MVAEGDHALLFFYLYLSYPSRLNVIVGVGVRVIVGVPVWVADGTGVVGVGERNWVVVGEVVIVGVRVGVRVGAVGDAVRVSVAGGGVRVTVGVLVSVGVGVAITDRSAKTWQLPQPGNSKVRSLLK